jgi:hypothetical protein
MSENEEKKVCPGCQGSGKCLRCNGSGNVAQHAPSPIAVLGGEVRGHAQSSRTCSKCYGSGMCDRCHGSGKAS